VSLVRWKAILTSSVTKLSPHLPRYILANFVFVEKLWCDLLLLIYGFLRVNQPVDSCRVMELMQEVKMSGVQPDSILSSADRRNSGKTLVLRVVKHFAINIGNSTN
jgi:hypothetical protein